MEHNKPIRYLFQLLIMSYVKVVLSQTCSSTSYTLIDEPKRSTLSVYDPETDMMAFCDDNIRQDKWFRFDSPAGQTIPERTEGDPVPMNHCGTQGPIYIRGIGSHPTADGTTVDATVCAHYSGNGCQWTETIRIHKCPSQGSNNSYFIYNLKRAPGCDIAYCAGEKQPCNRGDYWDGFKCVNYFPPMTGLPVLGGYYENGSVHDFTREVYFTCEVKYTRQPNDTNARFRVTFLFDGLPLETVNVNRSSTLKPFTITADSNKAVPIGEYYLQGRLRKQISCQVASYWDGYEPTGNSTMLSLNNFYPVFQSNSSGYTFYYSSGSTFAITFISSIPLTCSHCVGKDATCCRYEFRMGGSAGSSCQVRWEGIGSKKATASVTAVPGNSQTSADYGILFRPYTGDEIYGGDSLWRAYTVPPVKFHLIPSSVMYKQCSSTSDPNIKTFDARYYGISYVGDYYLTRAQLASKEMEIQVRQETCYWGVCDCGVIVREGNSAYKVSMCENGPSNANSRIPTVVRLLTQSPVDSSAVYRDGSGKAFSVRMPSGLRVEISTRADSHCSWMNIYAYLPPEYHGRTDRSSICGDSNGISNDDSNDPQSFRIPDNLNYFRTPPTCSQLFNPPVSTCDCGSTSNSFECSNYDPLLSTVSKANDYFPERWTSGVVCRQEGVFALAETTNETSDFILDPEILYPPYTHDPDSGSNISYTWPTRGGKLENDTELYCREMFASSASYSDCKDAVDVTYLVNVCKSDIQRIDEWVAAEPYLDIMDEICIHALSAEINSSNIYDNSTYSSLITVSHKMCPQQCSGRGTCVEGKCVCNAGFIGTDCGVEDGLPPTLTGIMKGDVCDARSKPCEVISVLGSGAVSTTTLKCRFYNKDTDQYSETTGTFVTAGEYSCPVPTTSTHRRRRRRRRSSENGMAALSQLSVSVTVDGAQYSNALAFNVYDAKCIDCSSSSNCKKKSNTCLIQNECFASNEISYKDPCQKCVPSTSEDSWVDITTYGSWQQCSRECDYGAQARDVICGNSVQATDSQLCKTTDCIDNPSEEADGVGVTLSQNDLEKILLVPSNTLKTFADTISEYCVENGDVCCNSIGKSHNGAKPVTYTSPEQLNYASGYPILNSTDASSASLKIMVKIDLALVESQCAGTAETPSTQPVFADKTLIYEIVSEEKSKIEQELGVAITSIWKPSTKDSATALKSSSLFILTTLCAGFLYTLLFQKLN